MHRRTAQSAFFMSGTEEHVPTDFPVPVGALLSDPRLESLVSQLNFRAYRMIDTMEDIEMAADSVRMAVREEIG